MQLRYAIAASLIVLAGCPAPEPAKGPPAPPPPSEADARRDLESAKAKNDPAALIAVFNKYPKFAIGKTALRLGARKYFEKALEAAEACDDENAGHALAKVAPYTADDAEIDEAYDETKNAVITEKKRCVLIVLDADVKKAENAWDYAAAFKRVTNEKNADGAALKKRRVELTGRWAKWLDATIKDIVAKRSITAAVGDKREAFDSATDADQLPAEVAGELAKRGDALIGIRLVFDKLEGGQLLDPPIRYWTFGTPKARRVDAPTSTDGATMSNGVPFIAIAKGKLGGVSLLVAGEKDGDALARLGSIKLLIPEADARTYDTRTALPEKLIGARVLAPIANGSDMLSAAVVLSEDSKDSVTVQPKKGSKLTFKKKDLRGMAMSPGMKVTVMVGNAGKPGELADAPEEDRCLVRVGGFENYFPLGDIRVKRSDLPKPPAD